MHVSIIGCGALGSRHLQSLTDVKLTKIFIFEPSDESFNSATLLFKNSGGVHPIERVDKVEKLINSEFIIVATPSSVRWEILEKLLNNNYGGVCLLEKVLFNDLEQYFSAKKIPSSIAKNYYVNCPRRMYDSYLKLLPKLKDVNRIVKSGKNWSLACNGIHFLDLAAFISSSTDYRVSYCKLSEPLESKRAHYIEFDGELHCDFKTIRLEFVHGQDAEEQLIFYKKDGQEIHINEQDQSYIVDGIKEEFRIPFQSELTGLLVPLVQKGQELPLSNLDESLEVHIPFFKTLLDHYNSTNSSNVNSRRLQIT